MTNSGIYPQPTSTRIDSVPTRIRAVPADYRWPILFPITHFVSGIKKEFVSRDQVNDVFSVPSST